MIKPRKVVLVGDGAVGSSYAYAMMNRGLGEEFPIIDIVKNKVKGDVMDLEDAQVFTEPKHVYFGTYKDCKDADIVVITAGTPQKKGETRLALVSRNMHIVASIVKPVVQSGFKGIFVVSANPVDIITAAVQKLSGWPKNKVIGTGTSLDTTRLQVALGKKLHLNPQSINAYIMGEHGDSEFADLAEASAGNRPLLSMIKEAGISKDELTKLVAKVRNKAYYIINAKGATYYGVAEALTRICQAVLKNENTILPTDAPLNGEYGLKDVYIGSPTVINASGIAKVIQVPLNDQEETLIKKSAATLRKVAKKGMDSLKK